MPAPVGRGFAWLAVIFLAGAPVGGAEPDAAQQRGGACVEGGVAGEVGSVVLTTNRQGVPANAVEEDKFVQSCAAYASLILEGARRDGRDLASAAQVALHNCEKRLDRNDAAIFCQGYATLIGRGAAADEVKRFCAEQYCTARAVAAAAAAAPAGAATGAQQQAQPMVQPQAQQQQQQQQRTQQPTPAQRPPAPPSAAAAAAAVPPAPPAQFLAATQPAPIPPAVAKTAQIGAAQVRAVVASAAPHTDSTASALRGRGRAAAAARLKAAAAKAAAAHRQAAAEVVGANAKRDCEARVVKVQKLRLPVSNIAQVAQMDCEQRLGKAQGCDQLGATLLAGRAAAEACAPIGAAAAAASKAAAEAAAAAKAQAARKMAEDLNSACRATATAALESGLDGNALLVATADLCAVNLQALSTPLPAPKISLGCRLLARRLGEAQQRQHGQLRSASSAPVNVAALCSSLAAPGPGGNTAVASSAAVVEVKRHEVAAAPALAAATAGGPVATSVAAPALPAAAAEVPVAAGSDQPEVVVPPTAAPQPAAPPAPPAQPTVVVPPTAAPQPAAPPAPPAQPTVVAPPPAAPEAAVPPAVVPPAPPAQLVAAAPERPAPIAPPNSRAGTTATKAAPAVTDPAPAERPKPPVAADLPAPPPALAAVAAAATAPTEASAVSSPPGDEDFLNSFLDAENRAPTASHVAEAASKRQKALKSAEERLFGRNSGAFGNAMQAALATKPSTGAPTPPAVKSRGGAFVQEGTIAQAPAALPSGSFDDIFGDFFDRYGDVLAPVAGAAEAQASPPPATVAAGIGEAPPWVAAGFPSGDGAAGDGDVESVLASFLETR